MHGDVYAIPSVALHLGTILPRTVFTDMLHDIVEGHIVLLACSVLDTNLLCVFTLHWYVIASSLMGCGKLMLNSTVVSF